MVEWCVILIWYLKSELVLITGWACCEGSARLNKWKQTSPHPPPPPSTPHNNTFTTFQLINCQCPFILLCVWWCEGQTRDGRYYWYCWDHFLLSLGRLCVWYKLVQLNPIITFQSQLGENYIFQLPTTTTLQSSWPGWKYFCSRIVISCPYLLLNI